MGATSMSDLLRPAVGMSPDMMWAVTRAVVAGMSFGVVTAKRVCDGKAAAVGKLFVGHRGKEGPRRKSQDMLWGG